METLLHVDHRGGLDLTGAGLCICILYNLYQTVSQHIYQPHQPSVFSPPWCICGPCTCEIVLQYSGWREYINASLCQGCISRFSGGILLVEYIIDQSL